VKEGSREQVKERNDWGRTAERDSMLLALKVEEGLQVKECA
jgi:hypothetical protein